MYKKIGVVLLVVGLLTMVWEVIWGWNTGVFDFSRTGAGVGLGRLFFLFLYFPVSMSFTIVGLILAFGEWVTRSILIKKFALVISILLFLFAAVFVASNVTHSYIEDADDVLGFFIIALPIVFLSGLFFFLSRLTIKN
ncbi:MAG: hypothetical protein KM312_08815 [Hydrogenibacillus schlegelii]|uniref:Uncharacterized protein n=1 Tax=Hydrogenibacillus schlegelii TaxID=1484 RepID=A0A947D4N9_HYDSH|nr:hypothetical protein [Hydrogenibacillus schlegelii]